MYIDPSGYCPFLVIMAIVGLVVGGGVGLGIGLSKDHTGWSLAKDILLGAAIGAAGGTIIGAATSIALTGAVFSTGSDVLLGLKAFAWAYSIGGPGAAAGYVINNSYTWVTGGQSMAGYYPSNDGFSYSYQTTLNPGTVVQRYGSVYGSYAAPYASDPFGLSLPYDKFGTLPSYYVVNHSVNVLTGPAISWFGQYGGGTQYLFMQSIYELIEQGIVSPL